MGKMYFNNKQVTGIVNKSYVTTIPDPQATSIGKTITTSSNLYRVMAFGTSQSSKVTTLTSSSYYNSVNYSSTSSEFSTSSRYSRSTYSTYSNSTATSSRYTRSTYSTSEKPSSTGSSYSRTYVTHGTMTLSPFSTSVQNSTYSSSTWVASVYGNITTASKSISMTSATFAKMTNQSIYFSYSVKGASRTYTAQLVAGSAPRWTVSVTGYAQTSTSSTSISSSKTNKIVFTTQWNLATSISGIFSQSIKVSLRCYSNGVTVSDATMNNTGCSSAIVTATGKVASSSTYSGTASLGIAGSSTQYWIGTSGTYQGYVYSATGYARQSIAQSNMTKTASQKGTLTSMYVTSNEVTYLYGDVRTTTFKNTRSSETYAAATQRDSRFVSSGTFVSAGSYNTTVSTTFGSTKEFYRYSSTKTLYTASASTYVSSGTFNSSSAYNTTSNTSSSSVSFSRYSSTTTKLTYSTTTTSSMTATKTYANASNSTGSTSYSNKITYKTSTY